MTSTSAPRRRWLRGALATVPAAGVGCATPASPGPVAGERPDPFGLGVASGDPSSSRVVLWTRLVADDGPGDGGHDGHGGQGGHGGQDGVGRRGSATLPTSVAVRWRVATDPGLRDTFASGHVTAHAADGHAVRVTVAGLSPDRPYWYRFEALGRASGVGRTRTLPGPGAPPRPLRIAVASCQNYEHGYYAAYRHMVAAEPDLIVHVGDYLYEGTWGSHLVRPLGWPEARSLADYRRRYARYRRDPDLQAAHAAVPWVCVWDDHEVENDYADLAPERAVEAVAFPARRAAAYRAWFEHMPVPPTMAPAGSALPLYRGFELGELAALHLLDTRQYRTPQACPPAPRGGGGNAVVPMDCAALTAPGRTLLGAAQETWLADRLRASRARWNLIAQQTLVSPLRLPAGAGRPSRIRTDGWDGYPAARQRLVAALRGSGAKNPVLLGGDLHAFYVAELPAGESGEGPAVAAEFVGTSISSQAADQPYYDRQRAASPSLRHVDGTRRGYLMLTVHADRVDAELVGLADVRRRDSDVDRRSRWVVEAGRPGVTPG